MPKVPFVLVGDAPYQPTGLSRIATDLAARLHAEANALGIDLLQVGAVPWGPLPRHGVATRQADWKTWAFQADTETWGRYALGHAIATTWPFYDGPLIVFSCGWDPGRCFPIIEWRDGENWSDRFLANLKLWGYFPVDGHSRTGGLGEPAAATLNCYDRVLAYGPYGAGVLKHVLGRAVEHLPHGINREVFRPEMTEVERACALRLLYGLPRGEALIKEPMVLGCVAANVARKDFPLFFATLAELRARGHNLRGWLHTNTEVGEWSVPQLAIDFGLGAEALTVTTSLSDRELACCYASCIATLAIGRGEGFGYPILESLACGTPAVHVKYAGGADLLEGLWRGLTVTNYDAGDFSDVLPMPLVGTSAIQRPLLTTENTRGVVESVIHLQTQRGAYATTELPDRTALVDRAALYDWTALWPRWRDWIRVGLLQESL